MFQICYQLDDAEYHLSTTKGICKRHMYVKVHSPEDPSARIVLIMSNAK